MINNGMCGINCRPKRRCRAFVSSVIGGSSFSAKVEPGSDGGVLALSAYASRSDDGQFTIRTMYVSARGVDRR